MTQFTDKELERVKRVIQGLRDKTEEQGCTEEEAMSAAAKMGQLLEQYDLSIDEVGVRQDAAKCKKNEVFAADEFAGTLVVGIKYFCGIIAYQEMYSGHGMKYVFFGVPHDLEIALYLYEVCSEAMEHDWVAYMERHGYSMKKRMSFRAGSADRVYYRLHEMRRERDERMRQATGTALMVLKDQLVTEEFRRQLGIKLVKARHKGRRADSHAYLEGQASGGRVNLNNPLGDPSVQRDKLR